MARKPCQSCGNAQAVRPGGLCNRCFATTQEPPMPDNAPVQDVPLDQIRIDGGTQQREATDEATVGRYAEAAAAGEELPPGDAFFDGAAYWLADGFHRLLGRRKAGMASMRLRVREGTRRDAVLFACGANASHGLPRTNADKRKAVITLLADEEWGQWSDKEIERRCRVGSGQVGRIRKELEAAGEIEEVPSRKCNRAGRVQARPGAAPKSRPPQLSAEDDSAAPESPPVVSDGLGKPAPEAAPAGKSSTKDQPLRDAAGAAVPQGLRDAFADPWLAKASAAAGEAGDAVRGLASGTRSRASAYPYLLAGEALDKIAAVCDLLSELAALYEAARPYAVCGACKGKGCEACRRAGLLPAWRHAELAGGTADASAAA